LLTIHGIIDVHQQEREHIRLAKEWNSQDIKKHELVVVAVMGVIPKSAMVQTVMTPEHVERPIKDTSKWGKTGNAHICYGANSDDTET